MTGKAPHTARVEKTGDQAVEPPLTWSTDPLFARNALCLPAFVVDLATGDDCWLQPAQRSVTPAPVAAKREGRPMMNAAIQAQLVDAAQDDPTVAPCLAAVERGLSTMDDGLALAVIALAAQVKALQDLVVWRRAMRARKRRLATTAGEAGGHGPRPRPVQVGTPRPHGSPSWRPWPRWVTRAGVLWLLVLSLGWLRLNVIPCVPIGLYRLHRVPASLERGMLVVLPVPASVQAFQSRWLPLLKPIAGLPGDEVCVGDEGFVVNGRHFGPVLPTSGGRAVPSMGHGCVTVAPASVIVATDTPRSLDSRYFGPVRITDLSAVATPVLTWR